MWRSKSETNLKSSPKPKKKSEDKLREKMPEKSESLHHLRVNSNMNSRPKSWSPNDALADILFPPQHYSCEYFFLYLHLLFCVCFVYFYLLKLMHAGMTYAFYLCSASVHPLISIKKCSKVIFSFNHTISVNYFISC